MEVFSFWMFDDSESRHSLTAGQPQGWPLGRLIPISASLSSSTAATSRHFPFGPPLKHWHVQRHIGFHYFHSYESATLDSSRAVMANPNHPPPARPHIHKHVHLHFPSTCSPCFTPMKILMWACDPSPFSQWNILCNCWLTSCVSMKRTRAKQLIILPL